MRGAGTASSVATSRLNLLHRMARSRRLIAAMQINLLNLQALLREANSTSPQNTLELGVHRRVCEAMAATLSPPRLLPSGDSAIAVEFSRNIDDVANQRVLALDRTLARETIAGVTDPVLIDFDTLGEKLLILAQMPAPPAATTRHWRIPVVYGGEHGIDLEDIAKALNTTPDDIVARHVGGNYRVAMIGFTPGWSYLSGLPDSLRMPRRLNPRLLTPAGTISIGGVQAGIQCLAAPSGWHLLGRTAVRTYQLHRDPTFLLEPGDAVTFTAVDAKTFAEQDQAAERGDIVAELMPA
jgi:KipI family sensor histidine kinase inhibitor